MKEPKTSHPTKKTRDEPPSSDKRENTDTELDEALEESFPASDPPSLTQPETGVGTPGDHHKKK